MESPTRNSSRSSNRDNTVSVNVAVRIRPQVEEDDALTAKQRSPVLEKVHDCDLTVVSPGNKKKFTFDHVFSETTTQGEVFDYLKGCIESLVKGYNVAIMAYGQSGSGKSYTMGTGEDPGSIDDLNVMGIVPRAAIALFKELLSNSDSPLSDTPPALSQSSSSSTSASTSSLSLGSTAASPLLKGSHFSQNSSIRSPTSHIGRQSMIKPPTGFRHKKRGSTGTPLGVTLADPDITNSDNTSKLGGGYTSSPWAISVSYLEIYNEQFRDLLNPNTATKLAVREDVKGNIYVSGLKEVVVESVAQLLQCLRKGSDIRQTNSTAINAQSSRSHAIFTILLTQKQVNKETGIVTTVTSKLNLVDLAGSERIKNSGANDGRIKEGISINSGLTALGKVISQLSSLNQTYVSYRDSKLTRVLQDSVGGKAITYLIACITTETLYLSETLNTLTYAQRARAIQATPEIQHIESSEDMIITIANLRKQLQYWKAKAEAKPMYLDSSISASSPTNVEFSPTIPLNISTASETDVVDSSSPLPLKDSNIVSSRSLLFLPSSPSSSPLLPFSESTVERVNRSTAFHSAVESIISEYEGTIASLQTALELSKETYEETAARLEDTQEELFIVRNTNQELRAHITMLHEQLNEQKSNEDIKVVGSPRFNSLEKENEDLKSELAAYRKEHKLHLAETQYLTTQYNSIRSDSEALKQQNKDLLQKLKLMSDPNGSLSESELELVSALNDPNNTSARTSAETTTTSFSSSSPSLQGHKPIATGSFFGPASAI